MKERYATFKKTPNIKLDGIDLKNDLQILFTKPKLNNLDLNLLIFSLKIDDPYLKSLFNSNSIEDNLNMLSVSASTLDNKLIEKVNPILLENIRNKVYSYNNLVCITRFLDRLSCHGKIQFDHELIGALFTEVDFANLRQVIANLLTYSKIGTVVRIVEKCITLSNQNPELYYCKLQELAKVLLSSNKYLSLTEDFSLNGASSIVYNFKDIKKENTKICFDQQLTFQNALTDIETLKAQKLLIEILKNNREPRNLSDSEIDSLFLNEDFIDLILEELFRELPITRFEAVLVKLYSSKSYFYEIINFLLIHLGSEFVYNLIEGEHSDPIKKHMKSSFEQFWLKNNSDSIQESLNQVKKKHIKEILDLIPTEMKQFRKNLEISLLTQDLYKILLIVNLIQKNGIWSQSVNDLLNNQLSIATIHKAQESIKLVFRARKESIRMYMLQKISTSGFRVWEKASRIIPVAPIYKTKLLGEKVLVHTRYCGYNVSTIKTLLVFTQMLDLWNEINTQILNIKKSMLINGLNQGDYNLGNFTVEFVSKRVDYTNIDNVNKISQIDDIVFDPTIYLSQKNQYKPLVRLIDFDLGQEINL